MAHAINLNAYADSAELAGIFPRLRQSFADYRKYRRPTTSSTRSAIAA